MVLAWCLVVWLLGLVGLLLVGLSGCRFVVALLEVFFGGWALVSALFYCCYGYYLHACAAIIYSCFRVLLASSGAPCCC